MKKIPSLFVREDAAKGKQSLVTNQVTSGCEWVLASEGVASKKWDGTAVLVKDGWPWKRYDAKQGKPAPAGGIPCQEPDPVTGHWPHWVKCDIHSPVDQYIFIGYHHVSETHYAGQPLPDGTYEAVGPKINGNRDELDHHELRKHGDVVFLIRDRSFDALKDCLSRMETEGVVFTHPDGRMCKVKRGDFGLEWPITRSE